MALGDDIHILRLSELFNLFDQEALRLLAFSAEHRMLKSGEVLFNKGDRADGGYIVKAGSLILKDGEDHHIKTVGPGALLGKLALFVRNTRPVTAVAVDQASVIRISPTLMRRVLEEFPSCAERVHNFLARDLEDFVTSLEQVRPMFDEG